MQERLSGVFTLLHVDQWESLLTQHPDRDYVEYIFEGIKEDFRVGIEDVAPLSSAQRNMQSAVENSQVVSEYSAAEISRGVPVGLFDRTEVPEVHPIDLEEETYRGPIPSQGEKCD